MLEWYVFVLMSADMTELSRNWAWCYFFLIPCIISWWGWLGVSYSCSKIAVKPDSQSQPSSIGPSCMSKIFVRASTVITMAKIPPTSLRYRFCSSGRPGVTLAPKILASLEAPCCITKAAVPNWSLYDLSHMAMALPWMIDCAMIAPFIVLLRDRIAHWSWSLTCSWIVFQVAFVCVDGLLPWHRIKVDCCVTVARSASGGNFSSVPVAVYFGDRSLRLVAMIEYTTNFMLWSCRWYTRSWWWEWNQVHPIWSVGTDHLLSGRRSICWGICRVRKQSLSATCHNFQHFVVGHPCLGQANLLPALSLGSHSKP